MLKNFSRKNVILKLLSSIALSSALLGIGTVATNSIKPQTVQAADLLQKMTPKIINHYIRLGKRSGTHYFKKPISLTEFSNADEDGTVGFHGQDVDYFGGGIGTINEVIGTKELNGVHYFITDDKSLTPIDNFYAPTAYVVKPGQTIRAIMGEREDGSWCSETTKVFHSGEHLVLLNAKVRGGREHHNGNTYYAISTQNGFYTSVITANDLHKIRRAALVSKGETSMMATFDKHGNLMRTQNGL